MSERECGITYCDRPVHDNATICGHCEGAMTRCLAETPWLAHELEIVITRRSRYGANSGTKLTRGVEQPLPYHIPAAEASANLKGILVSWTRMLLDEGQVSVPTDTLAAVSGWLLARVPVLRMHDAGPDAVVEICEKYRDALYAVDRPPDRLYLGTCGAETDDGQLCQSALWGREGRTEVECRTCFAVWDQRQRMAQVAATIDADMRDRLVTASEAALVIVARAARAGVDDMDAARLTDRVRKWAEPRNGRLPQLLTRGHARMATGGPDRALFRYGDVVALLDRRPRHTTAAA